ncbi:MAG: hypothetical protein WCP24_01175 [bacterium]
MKSNKNRGFVLLSVPSLIVAVVLVVAVVSTAVYVSNRFSSNNSNSGSTASNTDTSQFVIPIQNRPSQSGQLDCSAVVSKQELVNFFGAQVVAGTDMSAFQIKNNLTNNMTYCGHCSVWFDNGSFIIMADVFDMKGKQSGFNLIDYSASLGFDDKNSFSIGDYQAFGWLKSGNTFAFAKNNYIISMNGQSPSGVTLDSGTEKVFENNLLELAKLIASRL